MAEYKLPYTAIDIQERLGKIDNMAEKSHIPTKQSQLQNDTNFITAETDPTVPAWAKAANKPSYTAAEVGARSSTWMPSASDVGAVPTTRTVNNKSLNSNITLSASDVGAVPTTRTVNGKALSSNITLSASDVGALATNGKAASATTADKAGTLYESEAGTLNWSGDYFLSSAGRPNAKLHFGNNGLYQYRNGNYYYLLDENNLFDYVSGGSDSPTDWIDVTINSTYGKSGWACYMQCGNVVVYEFGITVTSRVNGTWSEYTLATGFPYAKGGSSAYTTACEPNSSLAYRAFIEGNALKIETGNTAIKSDYMLCGSGVYFID